MAKKNLFYGATLLVVVLIGVIAGVLMLSEPKTKRTFYELKSECNEQHRNDKREYIRDPCDDQIIKQKYENQWNGWSKEGYRRR